jgi:hypothetical protein
MDMTTDKFLLALQRFISRCGLPHTIYTDNAQTFHSANRELTELWTTLSAAKTYQTLAQNGIIWKFIIPRAALWGGWWERMVGSTRRSLRKVLGRSQVDAEELYTVLTSIEAALNSRRITQDDNGTLTPSHFLNSGKLTIIPDSPEPTGMKMLTKAFWQSQKLTQDLWRRWQKEYLLQLRNYHEVRKPSRQGPKFRVGDIVLLQEEKQARHMWKKARIEDLHLGRDNQIRTVILRQTDTMRISRPVQLVIPLEIDQDGEDVRD